MMSWLSTQTKRAVSFFRTKEGFLILVCSILLLAVSTYAAVQASRTYATNSDAIIDVYMFDDGFARNQVVLPGQHANVLKFPVFIAQGFLPYTLATFVLVNAGLVILAVMLWALLLGKLFGRKFLPLILLAFAALVFSSTEFNINLAETTIRSIEFPLALWFVLIINDVLRQRKFTKYGRWLAILGCVLYSVMLAGDSMFIYAVSLPILMVIGLYWLQTKKLTRPMINAGLIVAGASVGAFLIKLFLNISGLVITGKSAFAPKVVEAATFFPSIVSAAGQVLRIQGAYILGETAGPRTISLFINFALLLVGLTGIVLMIWRAASAYRQQKSLTDNNTFVFAAIGLSFVMTLGVYIFSGQVVQQLANGQIVSMGQIRYIAFLPLLLLVGLIWVIKEYYAEHRWLMILLMMMFVGQIVTVAPLVRKTYAAQIHNVRSSVTKLDEQASYLEQQGVRQVITGYWDGAPLRFWSENNIRFASIAGCKFPFDINTRVDWYKPKPNTKSALLVDRTGADAPFWNCSDQALVEIYGQPATKQTLGSVEIWVYNNDTRQSLPAYDRD